MEFIYVFGNYDDEFKKEAEERVKLCRQRALICQYFEFNDVDAFVILGVRAISSVMLDSEIEVEILAGLKDYMMI